MNSFLYPVSFPVKILYFLGSWPYLYTFILSFTNPSLISFQNEYSFSMLTIFEKFTFFLAFYFFPIREPNINPTHEMDLNKEKTPIIFSQNGKQ